LVYEQSEFKEMEFWIGMYFIDCSVDCINRSKERWRICRIFFTKYSKNIICRLTSLPSWWL